MSQRPTQAILISIGVTMTGCALGRGPAISDKPDARGAIAVATKVSPLTAASQSDAGAIPLLASPPDRSKPEIVAEQVDQATLRMNEILRQRNLPLDPGFPAREPTDAVVTKLESRQGSIEERTTRENRQRPGEAEISSQIPANARDDLNLPRETQTADPATDDQAGRQRAHVFADAQEQSPDDRFSSKVVSANRQRPNLNAVQENDSVPDRGLNQPDPRQPVSTRTDSPALGRNATRDTQADLTSVDDVEPEGDFGDRPPSMRNLPARIDPRPQVEPQNQAISNDPWSAAMGMQTSVQLDRNDRRNNADEPGETNPPREVSPPRMGARPRTSSNDRDPFLSIERRLVDEVAGNPTSLAPHLQLQLLRILRNDPAPSLSDLSSLPQDDRDLLIALVDGISGFRDVVRSEDNPLSIHKVKPLIDMAERFRARGDLNLTAVALCTAVRAYGSYDPIEPARFSAGASNSVVYYCEVDNFRAQLTQAKQWETKLSLEIRLFTESGMEVWSVKTQEVTDVSRKRRRDFFINKRLQLPPALAPGRYLLKSTVRDLQAQRIAESTIPIEMVAR